MTALLAGCVAACSSDVSYIQKNQALLQQIAMPPGARLMATNSTHYKRKNCEEPIVCSGDGGYVTTQSFSAQGVGPDTIVQFYVGQLTPDWSQSIRAQEVSGRTE
jgi:hypothetical protein